MARGSIRQACALCGAAVSRRPGSPPGQPAGAENLAANQMKRFPAAAVTLALLALGNGASLAQSAPPLPGVIGQTSPLGPPFAGTMNDVQTPGAENPPLPYSTTVMPCSVANPSTPAISTFDGGGFRLSVNAMMSGLPSAASSAANGVQAPCPSVSTSGITATATANSASISTSAAATSSAAANSSPAAAPNFSPNTMVQGTASLGTSNLGTTALGTTGLGSLASGSQSTSTKTTLSTAASSSGTSCGNASSSGMTTGGANMAMTAAAAGPKSQDESDLTGIVPDPAQILGGSLRSPAQGLGGTASTPAAPCTTGE